MNKDCKDSYQGRLNGRLPNQLRPIHVTCDAFGYSSGAVLFEIGNTKVLCCVSMQMGVPLFLKGTKTGWLTAEYSMLPTSTVDRTQRESVTQKRSGRSMEISRLIGRSLRAITKLDGFGERTIVVDCDVLQADGGTRTASISGSFLALKLAQQKWLENKTISHPFIFGNIAAISAGIVQGQPIVDLDYAEDNVADADFNFVLNGAGDIIEVQGSVEHSNPISWIQFESVRDLAITGVKELHETLNAIGFNFERFQEIDNPKKSKEDRVPLFSLKNRLSNIP